MNKHSLTDRFLALYLDPRGPAQSKLFDLVKAIGNPHLNDRILEEITDGQVTLPSLSPTDEDLVPIIFLGTLAALGADHQVTKFVRIIDDAVSAKYGATPSARDAIALLANPKTYRPPTNQLLAYSLIRSSGSFEQALGTLLLSHERMAPMTESFAYALSSRVQLLFDEQESASRKSERSLRKNIERLEADLRKEHAVAEDLKAKLADAASRERADAPRAALPASNGKPTASQIADDTRERLADLRRQYKTLEAAQTALHQENRTLKERLETKAAAVPLSVAETRGLLDTLRGTDIVTVGGYRGSSPVGTTRNYLSFLADTLGMQVFPFSADINPANAAAKVAQSERTILFTYCGSHKLSEMAKANAKKLLPISATTFDEQAFARLLHDCYVKRP